jgi:hypothetical protein
MDQLYAIIDWTQDIVDRISAIGERHFELVVLFFAFGILIVHLTSRRRFVLQPGFETSGWAYSGSQL